jgi:uracil-DNA glycosylase
MATQAELPTIQERIWACEACKRHTRVEINIRQQTRASRMATTLLFVGVAPS